MSEEKSEEKSVVERILEQGSTIKIAVQDYLDMKKVSDNRLETITKQALQIEEQIKRLKKARAQRNEQMGVTQYYKKLLADTCALLDRGNVVQDEEIRLWVEKIKTLLQSS